MERTLSNYHLGLTQVMISCKTAEPITYVSYFILYMYDRLLRGLFTLLMPLVIKGG